MFSTLTSLAHECPSFDNAAAKFRYDLFMMINKKMDIFNFILKKKVNYFPCIMKICIIFNVHTLIAKNLPSVIVEAAPS